MPQLFVDVDRDKVLKQGVHIADVYKILQSFMGSGFINYFNKFGRQWQIYIQAEGDYRTNIENIGQFYVRNNEGKTVPLSALTSVRNITGPEFTMRFNLYRSAQINATAAPGFSSTQAMKALEEVFAQTMPREMGYDYSGMSFQEKKAQKGISRRWLIFAFSFLCVFLILAAQYESWSLPFSVLLGAPSRRGRCLCRPAVPEFREQHLRPDRSGHADRPGGQERHPDRRIRQAGIRKRGDRSWKRPSTGRGCGCGRSS